MKFKKLEVNDFAGINHNSPVVIDFTQSKFIVLEGDQGLSKTNLINSLLMACGMLGAPDSKENKKFINDDTGKLDLNFDFTGKDKYDYSVRCTKSSFQLTYEGENIAEPMTKMKELLGVVGISPMEVKNRPLKEIVKWLAGYSNKSAEEFEAQMAKHKTNIKKAQETRAMANRSAKGLTEYLSNEDLYVNWEESEKKFKKPVDIKDLSQQLDVAGKKSDLYLQAETRQKQHYSRKSQIELQIRELQSELEITDNLLGKANKYLEDNKGVRKEYDTIKKDYDNAQQSAMAYNKWQDIKLKKTELDDFESIAQNADAKEKEILKSVKELQAEIIPDIRGLELVIEDTHEDGNMKKEGLYVDGKSVAKLSESQWWEIVLSIWRKYKVKAVVIDNYQSLGSGAFEILEKLAKDGAYILAAEMNREQKTLQINY